MTEPRSASRRLSEAEALRALYIDFEGEKGKPPVLLGVHRRGQGGRPYVHVHILDAAFAPPPESSLTLRASIENVVTRAEHGNRRIVSWSEHDLRVVRTLAEETPELVGRFEARYANALGVAEWWRNKLYGGGKPDPGRLADYLALIDYAVPADAVGGDVGDVIRDIRSRRERDLEPTEGQRERWVRLVEHNRHDCVGMRRVCLQAMREIEASDSGS